jgi:hypothetical protein
MKKFGLTLGLVLMLAVPAFGAMGPGGSGRSLHDDAGFHSSTETGPAVRPAVFSLCPSIADSAQVRNSGIDYIRTREFAEAVRAVANGTSRFAPARTPAEWKSAADLWGGTFVSNGTPRITLMPGNAGSGKYRTALLSPSGDPVDPTEAGIGERSCNPSLFFRASMEYRFRQGKEDAPLLYPHLVRKAVYGIVRRIVAKMDAAARSAKRVDGIADRIREAEKAGAGVCQRQELARTKADLAVARAMITDLAYDPGATDAALARAESLSENLLASQRFAASHRIRCVSE